MHITLYRKYRPASFSEVIGENEIIKSLKISLKNKSLAHAYIFSGPRGVGKTTTARLIAKGVNCLDLQEDGEPCNKCRNCQSINEGRFTDLIEIDAASNRSIDEIRALKEKINYQPAEGLKKVYIIDEAHMLTKEACNALLKTLEEPPEHVIFILATTELEKILPTIISRCQRYDFKSLEQDEMKKRLEYIAKEENIEINEEVYPLIYEASSGSMRDSISILERLIVSSEGNKIDLESAEETLGITPSSKIKVFLDKLLKFNEYEILEELENISTQSYDLELFFKDLSRYCKNEMLVGNMPYASGLRIISIIYETISKFKFEEDKRLVGYVIVADILNELNRQVVYTAVEKPKEEYVEKIREKQEVKEVKENRVNLNITTIKSKWRELLNKAVQRRISYRVFLMNSEPVELVDNTLKIEYAPEYKYAKEQMETQEYFTEFLEIIRHFFNEENLKIKFTLKGVLNNVENKESDFHQKIKDFFEGNSF